MRTIEFIKSRSVRASIVDSWYILALNWKKYLKHNVIPALVAGLSGAFAIEMLLQYLCQHFLPAYRLYQTKADMNLVKLILIPSVSELVLIPVSLLLVILFMAYYKGKVLGNICSYAENNELTGKTVVGLKGKERTFAVKSVKLQLIFYVLAFIVFSLIAYAAYRWQIRILYLLPIAFIYFWTTGNVSYLQSALGETGVFAGLKSGIKRSLGYAFIVQLLTAIPFVLVVVIFLLPAAIYVLSSLAAQDSRLVGDTAYMPQYLPVLFFVLNSIGLAVVLFFDSVRTSALAMRLEILKKKEEPVEEPVEEAVQE